MPVPSSALIALRAFVETARHGNHPRGRVPWASLSRRGKPAAQGSAGAHRRRPVPALQPWHAPDAGGRAGLSGLRQAFEQITARPCPAGGDQCPPDPHGQHRALLRRHVAGARLGQFTASHPQVEVRVEATALLADLRRERIDVAIRHGLGDYPGLDVRALMAPPLIPVASPRLLAEGPEIREAIDCLAYPLLQESGAMTGACGCGRWGGGRPAQREVSFRRRPAAGSRRRGRPGYRAGYGRSMPAPRSSAVAWRSPLDGPGRAASPITR